MDNKVRTALALICLLVKVCKASDRMSLIILHTNDIHLHFDESGASAKACKTEGRCYGGVHRLIRAVKNFQKQQTNVLVVDSGGMIDGWIMHDETGKAVVKDLVKPLPYDAMALGANELSGGVKAVAEYVRTVDKEFVCTNLRFTDQNEEGKLISSKCRKSMVKMFSGLKIGIVSYIQPGTLKSVPSGITILDAVASLKKEILHLQTDYYVKTIMVLGFSDADVDGNLIKEVPGVSLVISGHSHAMFYNGHPPNGVHADLSYPEMVDIRGSGHESNKVMLVGAYFHLTYMGMLTLDMDGEGRIARHVKSNPVFLNGRPEATIDRLLRKYRKDLPRLMGGRIGDNVFLLDGSKTCGASECAMGNVVADAMVDAVAQDESLQPSDSVSWSSSGTALLESGSIFSSILPGTFVAIDLSDALRRDTSVDIVRLHGSELLELLDHMVGVVHGAKKASRHFLQVSGLQVNAVSDEPQGRRLRNVSILCTMCKVPAYEAVVPNRTYAVTMTGVMAARLTRSKTGLLNKKVDGRRRTVFRSLLNVTTSYLKKISPVMVFTGDRIVLTKLPKAGAPGAPGVQLWVLLGLLLAAGGAWRL